MNRLPQVLGRWLLSHPLGCLRSSDLVCPERGPRGGTPTFWGPGQVGVDSVDLGVPRGRAPKVPEKAGRVGLDFIRTRPEVPPRGPRGPRGGTPMFQGSGQVGVDSIRPRGVPGQGPEGP